MRDIVTSVLLVLGAGFMLLSAMGLVRFPDLFMRMQATTKAATLGAGALLLATAVHFGRLDLTARALMILLFIFLTAPVAAHAIARAAHAARIPLWKGTLADELGEVRDEDPEAPPTREDPEEEPIQ